MSDRLKEIEELHATLNEARPMCVHEDNALVLLFRHFPWLVARVRELEADKKALYAEREFARGMWESVKEANTKLRQERDALRDEVEQYEDVAQRLRRLPDGELKQGPALVAQMLGSIATLREWQKQAASFFQRDVESGYHDGREELLAEVKP